MVPLRPETQGRSYNASYNAKAPGRKGRTRRPRRTDPEHWSNMRIALCQSDIPQNAGTIIRLAACLGAPASSGHHDKTARVERLLHDQITCYVWLRGERERVPSLPSFRSTSDPAR
jgi:hypothetical protein